MSNHYSAATLTPIKTDSSGAENLVKNEPRVNGFGAGGGGGGRGPNLNPGMSNTAPIEPSSGSDYWYREQTCCLVDNGRRCGRRAGNASYSKRIQKTVTQRKLKLYMDNSARHIYICDMHKNVIQSLRSKRKRKDSEDADSGETDSEHPEVDLYQLQVNTLRRYKKHYKVPSRPGLNKAQLADSLMRHFKTIPVLEKEALTYFIYMIKTNSSKFDRDLRREDVD